MILWNKLIKSVVILLAVVSIAAVCALFFLVDYRRFESGFLQSPDGKLVASVSHTFIDMAAPGEPINLHQTAALKVRDMDGKNVLGCTIELGKGLGRFPEVDLKWSPDNRRIACRSRGDLVVVEISTGEKKEISHSAGSFRWLDSSQIIHVSGKASVVRASIMTGLSEPIFQERAPDELYPPKLSSSAYDNEISPDCRLFIYRDRNKISVVDLQKMVIVQSLKKSLNLERCCWNNNSDLCLISGQDMGKMREAGSGSIEWSDLDVLYLFRRETGQFEELTGKLRILSGDCKTSLQTSHRVWLSDETSFLVSGFGERKNPQPGEEAVIIKDWICQTTPWSALCVQEAGGLGLCYGHDMSPLGGCFLMNKNETGMYLFKFSSDAQGKHQLTKPVKVRSSNSGIWFWSSDGKSIVTFEHGKFTVQNLP